MASKKKSRLEANNADELKALTVILPDGKEPLRSYCLLPENFIRDEIDKLIEQNDLGGTSADYILWLTNPNGTIELSHGETVEDYSIYFHLFIKGIPNVTLHLVRRNPGEGMGDGYRDLSSLEVCKEWENLAAYFGSRQWFS